MTFGVSDVIKIIRALDVNKAHGHDNISVRIIKLSITSVAHPLTLIFQNSMAAVKFATQWKRASLVAIHKKNQINSIKLSTSISSAYMQLIF